MNIISSAVPRSVFGIPDASGRAAPDAPSAAAFPAHAVLDAFVAGLCVVELNRCVRIMNRAAQKLVVNRDCLELHDGYISGVRPDVTRRLDQALRVVCGQRSHQDAFRIEEVGSGNSAVQVRVSALAGTQQGDALSPLLALITISRPKMSERSEAMLRSLFGLSHSEAAILNGLLVGKSLEQCAQSRGVAVSTARSQLKSIFAKTNTTSQAQLMIVANVLPPTESLSEAQPLHLA